MVGPIASEHGWYLDEYDGGRFWERVIRGAQSQDALSTAEGECWVWHKGTSAYARFKVAGREVPAHRVAFLDAGGKIPDGHVLDHLCRNTRCVRPSHLEPVTPKVNMERGSRAQRTECRNGHPYSAENTRVDLRKGKPVRICRQCHRDWKAARLARAQ